MTLALIRIYVSNGDKRTLGFAKTLTEAASALRRHAKLEARTLGGDHEVVQERDGLCVKCNDLRVSLFTFEESTLEARDKAWQPPQ